jgi:hypothetical protein
MNKSAETFSNIKFLGLLNFLKRARNKLYHLDGPV